MMNYPPYGAHQAMHDPYAAMIPPAPPLPVPPAEYSYGGAPPTYQANAMPYDYGGGQKLTAPPLIPPSQPPYHTATSGSAGMGGGPIGIGSSAGMGGLGGGASARVGGGATNTNSKDPKAVKARVFVGNLNTNLVTREQIHQIYAPFGEICAISMHKGYAFVQYAYENEARNAVTFTDGTLLGGKRIDVTISSEPKPSSDDSSGIKRSANVTITLGSADAKKPRLAPSAFAKKASSYSSVSTDKSSSGSKITLTSTNTSGTTTTSGIGSAIKKDILSKGDDIIICGQCRQLFSSVSTFTVHKPKCTAPPVLVQAPGSTAADSGAKNGVATPLTDVKKPEGEPDRLQCFICHTSFEHSWFLLEHMSQKHNMTVYELPPVTVLVDSASADKTKKETAKKEKD